MVATRKSCRLASTIKGWAPVALTRAWPSSSAACDVRGRLLAGWIPAEAYLLSSPEDTAAALAALRRKYGWQMRVADVMAKLSGRFGKRTYIRVETHEHPE